LAGLHDLLAAGVEVALEVELGVGRVEPQRGEEREGHERRAVEELGGGGQVGGYATDGAAFHVEVGCVGPGELGGPSGGAAALGVAHEPDGRGGREPGPGEP
jgi:hypothetical protein